MSSWLEGQLRWFAHPVGGISFRGHVQYPAFVPSSKEVAVAFGGLLVSCYSEFGSRKWQASPVFLPGNFHGQKCLAPVHRVAESDTTDRLSTFSTARSVCAQLSLVPYSFFVFCCSRCLSSWECYSEGCWVSGCLNADLS